MVSNWLIVFKDYRKLKLSASFVFGHLASTDDITKLKWLTFQHQENSHFTSQVKLFFVDKVGTLKYFGIKNAMQREIKKILTFVKL